MSTQVQDAARGVPGTRIPVELDIFVTGEGWREVGRGVTNAEGRILDFGEHPAPGIYRMMFDIASYLPDAYFPSISVTFEIRDAGEAHHVPLILSPHGYTVFRGQPE